MSSGENFYFEELIEINCTRSRQVFKYAYFSNILSVKMSGLGTSHSTDFNNNHVCTASKGIYFIGMCETR